MTPQFYLSEPAIQGIEDIADYLASQTGLEQAERFLSKLDANARSDVYFRRLAGHCRRCRSNDGTRHSTDGEKSGSLYCQCLVEARAPQSSAGVPDREPDEDETGS